MERHDTDGALAATPLADAARPDTERAPWAILQALLDPDEDSPFGFLEKLAAVVPFDRAMVLQQRDDRLQCIAALPADGGGRTWPSGQFLQSVTLGRVCALDPEPNGEDRAEIPSDLIPPNQAALCLPIGLQKERAVLILLRAGDAGGYGPAHLASARQWAVISLAGMIVRNGGEFASEIERLNLLVAQASHAEESARKDSRLLKEIVNHLPIALTVQDADGRFIVVNEIAATHLGTSADSLIGASPANFLSAEDAASRREWELGLFNANLTNSVEENVTGPGGEETWLTSHKPVHVLDRPLLVTSSLDITARKRIEMDLAQRAHFDELTGCPNRALIEKHVQQALARTGQTDRFALAFIDLDNFKHINDYYSHAIGDALLVKIALRITKRLRESDMLARISGDEFLLFLDPVTSEEDISVIVDGILADLKQPFQIETFEVFTSASIGVSIHPEHGSSYEELRRNADNAMYRAKADSKGGAIYFDVNMGQSITARMESEQRLRLAIRDRRFCCAFQPKVDIRSQEVIGFETLVRWRDADGEIQSPGTFIGLAIELGLIDPITRFVLNDALNSIDRLDEAFGANTTISVNIAAKQASDVQFMRSLAETLHTSNRAERIMLEVTEDAFVAKNRFQTQILPMLRDIGVRVSIDDFGTGYSSLSALADITADEIKVDRSFISGIQKRPRNQSVLRAIESLSYALGMTIVAEGVETFEELAYLQAATRIRYAQGYYFSKPFFLEDAATARKLSLGDRSVETARESSDRRRLSLPRSETGGRPRED